MLIPYLTDRDPKAAIALYKKALGATMSTKQVEEASLEELARRAAAWAEENGVG